MNLTVNAKEEQLGKFDFTSYFKNAFFIVAANYYFYMAMMAIYGFVAVQSFHYQYPVLHAIESLALILFLAILNVGVVLVVVAKFINISSKVLYFFPPLYCLYIKLGVPSKLIFTFSNFEELANVVLLFFITYVADQLLARTYLK